MFIASSVEQLDLAYAAQENLEHDVEVTIWSQGVFQLSRNAMASLIDVLDQADFGLFMLAPDDVTKLRNVASRTVRDNVIFELGMFVGRLGSERCFIVVPRGVEDLHLPTDLVGLTPADFEPARKDQNLVAALGPACNRVRKAIRRLGAQRQAPDQAASPKDDVDAGEELVGDPLDCLSLIESWMGGRPSRDNTRAIRFSDVDRDLKLVPGLAQSFLADAAVRWGYRVARQGKDTILFEDAANML